MDNKKKTGTYERDIKAEFERYGLDWEGELRQMAAARKLTSDANNGNRQMLDMHEQAKDFEDAALWADVEAARARRDALSNAANIRGFSGSENLTARRVLDAWSEFEHAIGDADALQLNAEKLKDQAYELRRCIGRTYKNGH